MNLKGWISSKKTKDMLATQAAIALVTVVILWMSEGDPEKVKSLMSGIREALALIAGVGGIKIAGQAAVDSKLAAAGKK